MKALLLSLAIVALAILLLGINALFRPKKGFPSGHTHDLTDIPRRQADLRHKAKQTKK